MHQKGPKKPQSILSLLSRGWNSLPGACSDLDLARRGAGADRKLKLKLLSVIRAQPGAGPRPGAQEGEKKKEEKERLKTHH